jgi:hypothetical protein
MEILQKQPMKNLNQYLLITGAVLLSAACNKDVQERTVPAFEPTNIEANGGTWKTILLAGPADITIPAPEAVGSAAYQAELAKIVEMQAAISKEDQQAIDNWKNSGIIKWNELARELVSKYNIPPEANADGTYPVPSAANPGAYPNFPFANPPYASRAYAYTSAATYDALVACWKYKFQYNRMSASVNDNKVKALETIQTGLPSYPSEDAVIGQLHYRMLKAFFPLDSVRILAMANEEKKAKMLSGVCTQSDIAAGEIIANAVADKFLARSKTDGMGAAVGNPTLWKALEDNAVANGLATPWKSLETPARPMMLPFFGNVKLWNFSSAQRDSLRPGPPPALGSAEFNKALEEVKNIERTGNNEQWRIAQLWGDGLSTYTPPGHWNEIACNMIAENKYSELRTARTLSLLNMAMQDAGICCWDTKAYYYYPRPSQMDPSIKTIGTPNFPSYTSGHATFSGAAAEVLGYIFPARKTQVDDMAMEATLSRIYGGIHYRFDSEVGLKCGRSIGTFAVKRGKADGAD